MASQSKGKNSKTVIELERRPDINWRETSHEGSSLILSVVKEAATLAPFAELKKAACTALLIFKTTQIVKENKEAYERLGYDSSGLIIAIWRSFKEAEDPKKWLSAEMRDILEDLSHTLENICSFLTEQLSKNKAIRVIFSRADGVRINEYREHLNYAIQKFELLSHRNINDVLIRVLKKNDQISEQILHSRNEEEVNHALEIRARDTGDQVIAEKFQEQGYKNGRYQSSSLERLKQVENNRQTEDERCDSDKLKKTEKETKDRKSELERLREAACALEEANRSKKAEEEEIAQLKRTLAAEEDNRRSNKIGALSSEKKSSRQDDEIDEEEEEEWEGMFMVEKASDEEEEEFVRGSSKVKRNASWSPKRRPVSLEDSTDDEDEDLQSLLRTARRKLSSAWLPEEVSPSMRSLSAKTRTSRRKLSSASLRVQETENDYTDDEDDCPKVKPQTRNVDDSMAQLQGFTPMGLGSSPHWNGSNSRSVLPMYMPPGMHSFPTYGSSFSPPTGPYGCGFVMPGTVINAGVGNVINTTIENVGNDNSVDHRDAVEVVRVRLVDLILWYTIFIILSLIPSGLFIFTY